MEFSFCFFRSCIYYNEFVKRKKGGAEKIFPRKIIVIAKKSLLWYSTTSFNRLFVLYKRIFIMAKEVSKVICGIASFFIPGLGQLLQGRIQSAIFWFVLILVIGALIRFAIIPAVSIPIVGSLGYLILAIAWIMNIIDAVR